MKVFSLDVKGWDKSLHANLFNLVKEFNKALLKKGGGEQFIELMNNCYKDMIECKVLLPNVNRKIKIPNGMKSGWCLTACDNTAIHKFIIDAFMKHYGYSQKNVGYLLYGDDNLIFMNSNIDERILFSRIN